MGFDPRCPCTARQERTRSQTVFEGQKSDFTEKEKWRRKKDCLFSFRHTAHPGVQCDPAGGLSLQRGQRQLPSFLEQPLCYAALQQLSATRLAPGHLEV